MERSKCPPTLGVALLRWSPPAGDSHRDGTRFFFRSGLGAGGAVAGDNGKGGLGGCLLPDWAQTQAQRGASAAMHGWPPRVEGYLGILWT